MSDFDLTEVLTVWRPILETAAGMTLESKFPWAKRFAIEIDEPVADAVSITLIAYTAHERVFSRGGYSTDMPMNVLNYAREATAYSIIRSLDNFAKENKLAD